MLEGIDTVGDRVSVREGVVVPERESVPKDTVSSNVSVVVGVKVVVAVIKLDALFVVEGLGSVWEPVKRDNVVDADRLASMDVVGGFDMEDVATSL